MGGLMVQSKKRSVSLVKSSEQLGEALRRFRKKQKLSQGELAEKAGLTQKTVSIIENEGTGTIKSLMLLLSALELDLKVLERVQKNMNDFEGLY